jgi:hypothetical protein
MWRLIAVLMVLVSSRSGADDLSDAAHMMQQCHLSTNTCRIVVQSNTENIKSMLELVARTPSDKQLWADFYGVADYQCIHKVGADDVMVAVKDMYRKYEVAQLGTATMIFNAFAAAVITKCRIEI